MIDQRNGVAAYGLDSPALTSAGDPRTPQIGDALPPSSLSGPQAMEKFTVRDVACLHAFFYKSLTYRPCK